MSEEKAKTGHHETKTAGQAKEAAKEPKTENVRTLLAAHAI